MNRRILLSLGGITLSLAVAVGCGGGSSSSNTNAASGGSGGSPSGGGAANSVSLSVGPGPSDMTNPPGGYTNILFTTITLCNPGTSTCKSIDHVLVDTGSSGLRVLASEIPSGLNLPQATVGGKNLYECLPFVDSYTWGTVSAVDLEMAGEKASSLPIQVIENAAAPSACSNTVATSGSSAVGTVNDLGAKGIIGVGNFSADCGGYCASVAKYDFYFTCSSSAASSCTQAAVPVAQQVVNPVALFSGDNNGVVIQMASVGTGGEGSASGTMYFGVGTQSNNKPGSVTVLGLNGFGNFGTSFQSKSFPNSFADTGSNALFFGTYDTSTKKASTGIAVCNLGSSANPAYFYCPSSELSESATMSGATNPTSKTTVDFNVGNANTLNGYAMSDLAATNSDGTSFDWGLPFFYGRTVYVGLEGTSSSLGSGMYVAF